MEHTERKHHGVAIGNTVLGNGAVKICIPLTSSNGNGIDDDIVRIIKAEPDLIEWRIDCFDNGTVSRYVCDELKHIKERSRPIPVLCTFRSADEGGRTAITDNEYEKLLEALCRSGYPDALDVELWSKPEAGAAIVAASHEAGIPVIGSNHDFEGTPAAGEILERLQKMNEAGADIVKMAVMPNSEADVDVLLEAAEKFRSSGSETPFILISMGELGIRSRISAAEYGISLTFATAGKSSAPGQMPAEELRRIMRGNKRNAGL